MEMKRSQKSENTRAEVKLSTRDRRESWGDPQTEQKREAVPFQNLPEPHIWVRGSPERLPEQMGRWAGRGKGNRVEPQERGTPLPCTARLTSSLHRGLAPLPAQQELLSDPEPLAETPQRTPGRAGRGHPRPPRRALSRSGCGCKRSRRPRQGHPSARAEPAGQLEPEGGILATALLGRGTGWGPMGEGRTPQGPGHRAPGTDPCADPIGLCNGRGPTGRPSPGPAGHPPSDPQGRVVQQDADNVE